MDGNISGRTSFKIGLKQKVSRYYFCVLQLNGKQYSYKSAVSDKMIEALGGLPGKSLEKKPTVAITAPSNERFPLCVYKVDVHVHSFPLDVIYATKIADR